METSRIARLVGLAKVWGAVKFFHPYLAYREIDWDKALVVAIPEVNAAKTPQEYAAALNAMLAELGDGATRAKIAADVHGEGSVVPTPDNSDEDPVRLENGTLCINAVAVAAAFARDNERYNELLQKTDALTSDAKAVLIDARVGAEYSEEDYFYLNFYVRNLLPTLLDDEVTLAAMRYRMHNGYARQTGPDVGGGFSSFVTNAPNTLTASASRKTPPLSVVINEKSGLLEILSGLQAADMAFIVQDGDGEISGGPQSYTISLPDNVQAAMRTTELVNPDGTIGFSPDFIAPRGEGIKAALQALQEGKFPSQRVPSAPTNAPLVSQKDKTYPEMEFPGAEYRLLALFRFWNVIHYFFPYKSLTDRPWDEVLPHYIPKFEANRDAADYQMTVREMVTEINDSHGGIRNGDQAEARLGTYCPPVVVRYIENQPVIVDVLESDSPARKGDVILTIDGETAEQSQARAARILPASTPQALERDLSHVFLRGQKDASVQLTVRGIDGKERVLTLARTLAKDDPRRARKQRSGPVIAVLPSGFGYVDLDRLPYDDVDKMFETLKNTPALILDLRGVPWDTAWTIAPRLTEKKTPLVSLGSLPLRAANTLHDADYFENAQSASSQRLSEPEGDIYRGDVVILIDENAQSHSEASALFFRAADVTFIGTPTGGANGNGTNLTLPGNLIVRFSGGAALHPDGKQLQRVGIQPDLKIAPTIRGSLAGRDEILEAAVKYLKETIKEDGL